MREKGARTTAIGGVAVVAATAGLALLGGALAVRAGTPVDVPPPGDWTPHEQALIGSMSLDALPPLPPSPGNPVADDPRAVALGHRLFFDERLGAGGVSCASCHDPELGFSDGRAGRNMHDGRFRNLREVLAHYDEARPTLISDELEPLGLDEVEFRALEAFLHALDGGLATPAELLMPPSRAMDS